MCCGVRLTSDGSHRQCGWVYQCNHCLPLPPALCVQKGCRDLICCVSYFDVGRVCCCEVQWDGTDDGVASKSDVEGELDETCRRYPRRWSVVWKVEPGLRTAILLGVELVPELEAVGSEVGEIVKLMMLELES